MGLKDLSKLLDKKFRLILLIIVWLLVGFTFLHFEYKIEIPNSNIVINGVLIFWPLLILCLALFLASFFLRADLIKPSRSTLIRILILLLILIAIFIYIGYYILEETAILLLIISIFSYILITALFAMHFCYENGVKLDDIISETSKTPRFIMRFLLFVGGILGAIWIVYSVIEMGGGTRGLSSLVSYSQLVYMIDMLPWLIIYIYIGFGVLAALIALKGKLNAWLGIFFLFTSLYAAWLLIDAFESAGVDSEFISGVPTIVFLYCVELFILLIVISGIIGKKAEIIEEKIGIINYDAILVWLIFSKAAYEFADATLRNSDIFDVEVSVLKSLGAFLLFIPLIVLMALYGIMTYKKKR